MTVKLSTPKLVAGAIILAVLTALATFAMTGPNEPPAQGIVRSWNAAVATIEPEDANFHELLDSYKRNPPGAVLMTPDVRAEQKRRRLKLIEAIIQSHQDRIRNLQGLARFEAALP